MVKDYQKRIETALDDALPRNTRLAEAMRYAVLNGGKRLRACLIYAVGTDFNHPLDRLTPHAMAIEAIHAYSLVHDDLPAMDNDDFRRGQLSCHKKFDEATAILAGDALQSWAFGLISAPTLAEKALLMVEGQMLDMEATGQPTLALEALLKIYAYKTGALFQACFYLGSLEFGDGYDFETMGRLLGYIYQIQDDILDATQSSESLGKTAGKDAEQDKNTILKAMPLNEAEALLNQYKNQLFDLVRTFPNHGKHTEALLNVLFNRTH